MSCHGALKLPLATIYLSMSSESSTPGPSKEDQTTFERWRRHFSMITGLGGTQEERAADMEAYHHRMCEKRKRELMTYSQYPCVLVLLTLLFRLSVTLHCLTGPAVVFMMKHLKLTGADVSEDDIVCAPCDFNRSGGFIPEAGVVLLCQGKFLNKGHMEDTIVHELVHMYDHAKFKVDWNNLRHHACSEVRALLLHILGCVVTRAPAGRGDDILI